MGMRVSPAGYGASERAGTEARCGTGGITMSDARGAGRPTTGYARIVAVVVGVFLAGSGTWAMVDPESFFDIAATFDPYNQHFVQDIGAFQIGLGAVLLLASWPDADGLAVALLGVGIGSLAHVISHAVGHDLGGTPEVDIPFFSTITVLTLSAGYLRWRDTRA